MSSMEAGEENEISDTAILSLLNDADWPLATTEVAKQFGESQQNTHYYLSQLAEEGRIEKRVAGGTAIWRPVS